jgi:RNA polymerase sigma factor (sigma-70 family)
LSTVVNAAPIEQTGAWLYRVARNKITDKYRKRTEWLLDDLLPEDTDGEGEADSGWMDMLMSESKTPESEYIRNLFWEELFTALDELPTEQKQVFIWQELEHKTFDEIADETGVKVQTLVSRKRYAVLHLRKRLKQLYDDMNDF